LDAKNIIKICQIRDPGVGKKSITKPSERQGSKGGKGQPGKGGKGWNGGCFLVFFWNQSPLIWVFAKIGVPLNGRFITENPVKMDDLGVPVFSETSIYNWKGSKPLERC